MHQEFNQATFLRLAQWADAELSDCLRQSAAGQAKLGEVRAVEAVVSRGMRAVARRWRRSRIIQRAGLELHTVFCHAAPKVTFTRPNATATGTCELADLLIVFDDPAAQEPYERRRAVLIQAKLHDPPRRLSLNSGNEKVQFELLSGWPPFKFKAGFYKSHERNLKIGPAPFETSGEYGGIDQPPACDWTQHLIWGAPFAPNPALHGQISLGKMLAGMLDGRANFGRPAAPHGTDPWSETVQELMDTTYRLGMKRSTPNVKRGRRHTLTFHTNLGNAGSWIPDTSGASGSPPSRVYEEDGRPDGAISVVHFISTGKSVRGRPE